MLRNFDRDKTYTIEWKNDEAKNRYWIHMHCRLVESHGPGDVPDYKRRCNVVYQLMSLYDDVDRFGEAYGGWLNEIKDLDKGALTYLKIKEKK